MNCSPIIVLPYRSQVLSAAALTARGGFSRADARSSASLPSPASTVSAETAWQHEIAKLNEKLDASIEELSAKQTLCDDKLQTIINTESHDWQSMFTARLDKLEHTIDTHTSDMSTVSFWQCLAYVMADNF